MTDPLAPGDAVVAVSGRLRGGKGIVVSIEAVPTPSGRMVTIVTIERPRAGQAHAFPHDLRKVAPNAGP